MLKKVGHTVYRSSQQGGGAYVIIGHVNCNRCDTLNEEREILEPSKAQKKTFKFSPQYTLCTKCGLYNGLKLPISKFNYKNI